MRYAVGIKSCALILLLGLVSCNNLVGQSKMEGTFAHAFSLSIPFTMGTDSSYHFSNANSVELAGGVCRLRAAEQTDSDNLAAHFGAATHGGTQWDSAISSIRLSSTTNNSELDASWTPQWSSLVGYWKLDGSGSVAAGSTVAAAIGTSATEANYAGGTLVAYGSGKVNQGAYFSSANTRMLNVGNGSQYDYGATSFTVSYWIKFDTGATNPQWSIGKGDAYRGTGCSGVVGGNGTGGWGVAHWTTADPVVPALYLSDGNACVHGNGGGSALRGQWAHFVVRINRAANTATLFVDGVPGTFSIASLGTMSYLAGGYQYLSIGRGAGSPIQGAVMDEVAIWNTALSDAEVQLIYDRQAAKFSGTLTSRVMNGLATSPSWTSLSSTTSLPFYKELPGSSGSESSTSYSASAGNLMTDIAGLWHLDESAGVSFADSSGHALTATSAGGVTPGSQGRLRNAAKFNGTSGVMTTASAISIYRNQMTMSAWVYANTTSTGQRALDLEDTSTLDTINAGNGFRSCIYLPVSTWNCYASTSALPRFQWALLSSVYDGSAGTISLYLNGKLDRVVSGVPNETPSSKKVQIGAKFAGAYSAYWNGSVDEVAIWSRALTSAEILEVYRRGANRVKYQVRACTASDCSDQEALTSSYKGWVGPDGSGSSYFSELYNTTANALGGAVSTASPTMTFANFSGSGLAVAANPYFQYRAVLESDDSNSLCTYGGSAANCSPELQTVSIGPTHYDNSSPTITSAAAIGSNYQALSRFSESGASCSGGLHYSLSGDGITFYYWNGTTWAISSGYPTANDAATIQAHISEFPAAAGAGTIQVKTYLKSDGLSSCSLDELELSGVTRF